MGIGLCRAECAKNLKTPCKLQLENFFEETNITLKSQIHFLTKFENLKGGTFHVFYTDIKDLLYPDARAIDAIEHDEWGFFKIEKNCLPSPITKETRNAILMLK